MPLTPNVVDGPVYELRLTKHDPGRVAERVVVLRVEGRADPHRELGLLTKWAALLSRFACRREEARWRDIFEGEADGTRALGEELVHGR